MALEDRHGKAPGKMSPQWSPARGGRGQNVSLGNGFQVDKFST